MGWCHWNPSQKHCLREGGCKQWGLNVSSMATELVKGLEHKSYRSDWGRWGCLVWRKESQRDPIALYNHLKGRCSQVGISLFSHVSSERMRGNDLLLCQERFKLDIREKRSLKECSGIGVSCPGMWCRHWLWKCLRGIWIWHLGIWFRRDWGGWWLDWMILKVSSNLDDSAFSLTGNVQSRLFCASWICILLPLQGF